MSKLSNNIMYNIIGQGLTLILSLVAVKYVYKKLGGDALGIIYFISMMSSLFCSVLELGVCSTTVREVSAHLKSEPKYIKDLIRTFSLFYWGAYALLGVGTFFLAPVIVERWINLETMNSSTAIFILRILGISSIVALPQSFYTSLLRGIQRMEFNNFIDVVTAGLQQFGTIFIIAIGGNLLHVAYWITVCYGTRIFSYIVISAHFFSLQALVPGYSPTVIKRNIGFASRMVAISVISAIHTQADKLIISKLLPIGVIGYYGFAYGCVSKATLLTSAIAHAAFPLFSDLFKAGDHTRLMSEYRKLQDLLCYLIVPLFAAIPFALLPLFSYILAPDIAHLLLLPTTLLCVGFYMNGSFSIAYIFSLAVGKPGITVRMNFYALFVVLPATILLIYFFGLTGAGLSWIFYHIFSYSYGGPKICSECLKIPVWEAYSHLLKIFFLACLTYGLSWITIGEFGTYSFISLIIGYFSASIIFFFGAYFLIGKELREGLFRFVKTFKTNKFFVCLKNERIS